MNADRSPNHDETAARHERRHSAGFTVVEVLVALSIMVVVSIPILMVLRSATTADAAHTAKIDATRSGAIAVEQLSADIRSATTVQISPTGLLQLSVVDRAGASSTVTWGRNDELLVRTTTVGGKPIAAVVLDDLATLEPATPFTAYDQNGTRIMTSTANCPGYISVDVERQTRTGTTHLVFDAASRNLNAGSGSC